MKYILHLPRNAAVSGELGQFTIHLFWKENILKYWCRMNTSELPFDLQQSLTQQLDMLENGKNCWLTRLYDTAGLPFKFNMASTDHTTHHVNEIMKQVSDQFIPFGTHF